MAAVWCSFAGSAGVLLSHGQCSFGKSGAGAVTAGEEIQYSMPLAGAASKKAGTAKTTRTTVSVRKVKLAKKAKKTCIKKGNVQKKIRTEIKVLSGEVIKVKTVTKKRVTNEFKEIRDCKAVWDQVGEWGGIAEGTSHYLSGAAEIAEVICRTDIEGGCIFPNVENIVDPSFLLAGKRLEKLLKKLEEEHRYVLLDSPPLELVPDGERIGSLCDGAILVVREGMTPKRMIKHTIQMLERAGCPLLGIVLNRASHAGL